jgi:hypothetical protein
MTWIIVLLALIFLVLCGIFLRLDHGLAKLHGTLIAASDLNLEAQAETRNLMDDELRRQSREREAQHRREY